MSFILLVFTLIASVNYCSPVRYKEEAAAGLKDASVVWKYRASGSSRASHQGRARGSPMNRHRIGSTTSLFTAEDGTIWSRAISLAAWPHAIEPLRPSEASSRLLDDVSF